MAITAAEVNKLRQLTGVGMMDCKKALTEAQGDIEKAIEILRKKGQKVSDARSDREATEGTVFVKTSADKSKGILITLNCETDFVGKNKDFQALGNTIAEAAFEADAATTDEILKLKPNDLTVSEMITDMIGRIGEKIQIGEYVKLSGDMVVSYIHAGNKLGVLVVLKNADGAELEEAGRDIGMQIAAMNPVAVDRDNVDQFTIDKEIEIGRQQAMAEGKPSHIVDKIAEGKLQKFFKEKTLLNQAFVKDSSMTVASYLSSVKAGLTVSEFKRVAIE